MAWTLRWPLWRSSQADRRINARGVILTVGAGPGARQVALTSKDVWQLRNGFMILRDGLLVVPEDGKLRFLQADPSDNVERKVLGELDAKAIGLLGA